LLCSQSIPGSFLSSIYVTSPLLLVVNHKSKVPSTCRHRAPISTPKRNIYKEIKLDDLKKFADTFKLAMPVPSEILPLIAKNSAKQNGEQRNNK